MKFIILASSGYLVLVLACNKPKITQSQNGDPQVRLITAFLSGSISGKTETDGLWIADQDDFAAMIERKFLKEHKPIPGDLSIPAIQKNVRDSRYFLRLDGVECDELFLLLGGLATARPGQKKAHPTIPDSFRAIFVNVDAKTQQRYNSAAEIRYVRQGDYLVMDMGGKPFRLWREKTSPEELVQTYAKPALATELPQY